MCNKFNFKLYIFIVYKCSIPTKITPENVFSVQKITHNYNRVRIYNVRVV